jgi:hypothetical protein
MLNLQKVPATAAVHLFQPGVDQAAGACNGSALAATAATAAMQTFMASKKLSKAASVQEAAWELQRCKARCIFQMQRQTSHGVDAMLAAAGVQSHQAPYARLHTLVAEEPLQQLCMAVLKATLT